MLGPSWEVKSEPKSIKIDEKIGLFFGRFSKRIFDRFGVHVGSILGPFLVPKLEHLETSKIIEFHWFF